jgi:rSAM/selenodomain-associated transferase 2
MPEAAAMRVAVLIPALNEERALPLVLADLAKLAGEEVQEIVVVDNGSTDRTADVARAAGATVVREPRRGYGAACGAGISYLRWRHADVIVFLDGDRSDFIEDLPSVTAPIREAKADLVIGSRLRDRAARRAVPMHARAGNWLATGLIRMLFGHRYTDLGPFRAIRFAALEQLGMTDRSFGWTVEMQVRAVQRGLRVVEVPVRYRRRIGTSKISGTMAGTLRAGVGILATIGGLWRQQGRRAPQRWRPPAAPSADPWLSVIVPTVNEAMHLETTLRRLGRSGVEVIVVDGGSEDDSTTRAARYADRVLATERGRAVQMNAGAAAARGAVLLFLHADTLVPDDYAQHIRDALDDPRTIGGRFDVCLDAPGVLYALIGTLISWRSRVFGGATGDQAIFVRREVFRALGGYPEIPFMEDVALSRALARRGRVAALRAVVTTSARRWQHYGAIRTILLMWWLRLRYAAGVSPEVLRRAYPECPSPTAGDARFEEGAGPS